MTALSWSWTESSCGNWPQSIWCQPQSVVCWNSDWWFVPHELLHCQNLPLRVLWHEVSSTLWLIGGCWQFDHAWQQLNWRPQARCSATSRWLRSYWLLGCWVCLDSWRRCRPFLQVLAPTQPLMNCEMTLMIHLWRLQSNSWINYVWMSMKSQLHSFLELFLMEALDSLDW